MKEVKGQCLICQCNIPVPNDGAEERVGLDILFLLRKVLDDVSDSMLTQFLEDAPTWIGFCEPCHQLMDEFQQTHGPLYQESHEVKGKVTAELPDVAQEMKDEDDARTKMSSRFPKLSLASKNVKRAHGCVFCPAQFIYVSNFERHLRVHTRERPFWCDVCGQELAKRGDSHRHLLIHSGERPHACKLCKKRFRRRESLSGHVRAHLGKKHFKCPDCGKAFVHKRNRTRHQAVHTKEKSLSPKLYSVI